MSSEGKQASCSLTPQSEPVKKLGVCLYNNLNLFVYFGFRHSSSEAPGPGNILFGKDSTQDLG